MANTDAQYLEALKTARDDLLARRVTEVEIDTGLGKRMFRFIDLKWITEQIDKVERKITRSTRGGMAVAVVRRSGA